MLAANGGRRSAEYLRATSDSDAQADRLQSEEQMADMHRRALDRAATMFGR